MLGLHGAAPQEVIQVAAGDYVVQVHVHELPDDVNIMVKLLIFETAPLPTWIDVAKAYLSQRKVQQYEAVLQYAISSLKAVCDALQVQFPLLWPIVLAGQWLAFLTWTCRRTTPMLSQVWKAHVPSPLHDVKPSAAWHSCSSNVHVLPTSM